MLFILNIYNRRVGKVIKAAAEMSQLGDVTSFRDTSYISVPEYIVNKGSSKKNKFWSHHE